MKNCKQIIAYSRRVTILYPLYRQIHFRKGVAMKDKTVFTSRTYFKVRFPLGLAFTYEKSVFTP